MLKTGCIKQVRKGTGDEAMYKVMGILAATQHVTRSKLLCSSSIKLSVNFKRNILPSCIFSMDVAVVYTVIVDSLFVRVVQTVSGTSHAELIVLRVFSRVNPVTGVSGSCVQLFVRFTTAYTFLENYHSLNNLQSAI